MTQIIFTLLNIGFIAGLITGGLFTLIIVNTGIRRSEVKFNEWIKKHYGKRALQKYLLAKQQYDEKK